MTHHTLDKQLETYLKNLGHFIYFPNPGNLGDEFIATATLQQFDRLGLSYEIYDKNASYGDAYNLVYGGGGAMIPEWNYLPVIERILLAPEVKRCVVLPHSIRQCDSLLLKLKEHHTLFCREQQSYNYCLRSGTKARVYLADDMSLLLNRAQLPTLLELQKQNPPPALPIRIVQLLFGARQSRCRMLGRYYRKTYRRLHRHITRHSYQLNDGRTVGIMMRRDREAMPDNLPAELAGLNNTDVSRYGGSNCRWKQFNELGTQMFLNTLQRFNIIITDRLHIALGAALLGIEVLIIDNNYQKLSGVWQQSMQNIPHCHMCHSAAEITSALAELKVTPGDLHAMQKTGKNARLLNITRSLISLFIQKRFIRTLWKNTHTPDSKSWEQVLYELREMIKLGVTAPIRILAGHYFRAGLHLKHANTYASVCSILQNKLHPASHHTL